MSVPQYRFQWSKRELSLKDFVSRFHSKLPLLVRVSQGLCGKDDSTFSFATSEEIYITHVNTQRRLVAKDNHGMKLSIPPEYPIRFLELHDGRTTAKAPLSAKDLITSNFKHGMRIIPEKSRNMEFWLAADQAQTTEIKELEMLDLYDDSYLVGNSVIQGQVSECPMYIPLFLSIKFNIAEGLKKGDFYEVMSSFYHRVDMARNATVPGNPEIMRYTDLSPGDPTEYTYIEPKSVIAYKQTIDPMSHCRKSDTGRQNQPPSVQRKPEMRHIRRPTTKPPPPLPPGNQRQPTTWAGEASGTQPSSPQLAGSLPVITSDQIKSVRLKHTAVRSHSTCVTAPDYDNLRRTVVSKPPIPGYRMSNQPRPNSMVDKDVYQEIPANFDTESSQERSDNSYINVEYETQVADSGYMRVGDVPKDLKSLSMKGVGECLKLLNLSQYVEQFADKLIDGDILTACDNDVLRTDLGMCKLDATKLLKFVHEGWRPK